MVPDLQGAKADLERTAAFAIMLVSIGILVLTGFDKRIETFVVDQSPQWLIDLTTRF